MKIILINQGYYEEIEVEENLNSFLHDLNNVENRYTDCIRLTQTKCRRSGELSDSNNRRTILLSPKLWAKIEIEE